jgi:hypothetical protein
MSTPTAVSPWTAGLKAARDNFWPSVLILVSATVLVVSYYHAPVVTTWLNCIGDINRQYPSGFAFWCTAVTAGLIPWCFRMLWPALRPHHPFRDLFHSFFWWAFMGIIVRYFYALQSLCFGAEVSVETVVKKVLFDQLVFTVFCGAPFNAISHFWKDADWDLSRLRAAMAPGWYRRLVLPNLLPNYLVWLPGTLLFYSMPAELQLPVANCIGCFWALMCVRIAKHSEVDGK